LPHDKAALNPDWLLPWIRRKEAAKALRGTNVDKFSYVAYKLQMKVEVTEEFDQWLKGLRDHRAKAKILVRIERLADGNPGDVKPVGNGVSEMRIDEGAGYRVYFFQKKDGTLIIILCGGDKDSQQRDIEKAKTFKLELER
jgi:putative addiction module killer protein